MGKVAKVLICRFCSETRWWMHDGSCSPVCKARQTRRSCGHSSSETWLDLGKHRLTLTEVDLGALSSSAARLCGETS